VAGKQGLRELQTRLAERLQQARDAPVTSSWLAVESGSRGFLFPLKDAGEIFAVHPVVPVPHSHPWFLGVANLRGHLHGVVDLGRFLGVKADDGRHVEPARDQARLVGFNQALGLNCVLLVDRLAGLRGQTDLEPDQAANDETPAQTGERPPFAGACYRDANRRVWQELRLAELAEDENFLGIVG
jgi:twitching motility protein PilI